MRFSIRFDAAGRRGRDASHLRDVAVLATGSVARTKPPPPRHMSWWTRCPHSDARVAKQDDKVRNPRMPIETRYNPTATNGGESPTTVTIHRQASD